MTPAAFLRIVLILYGDHWQKPLQALLLSHGHEYSRQQLWNWKKGNRRIPDHVEAVLLSELKPMYVKEWSER